MLKLACVLGVMILLAVPATLPSQIVDGCVFEILEPTSLSGPILVCPAGDGGLISGHGGPIVTVARDLSGNPIANIPASDYWLIGCDDGLLLCGGSGAINADGPSDVNGMASISGVLAASGCDTGFHVVVQGIVAADPDNCSMDECIPGRIVSPDFNNDLVVNLVDFALFASAFTGGYDVCYDFNGDGSVGLIDLSIFAFHWQHLC